MYLTRPAQRGFTLFELIIVIVVVAILVKIAIDRLEEHWEAAEKAAMEQIVGVIKSSLHLQSIKLIAQNRAGDIKELVTKNPINWLAEKPRNYLGEFNNPSIDDLPKGNWYFDTTQHQLVYLVNKGDHFLADKSGKKLIRYQVALIYSEDPKDLPKNSEINGITLKELTTYKWF